MLSTKNFSLNYIDFCDVSTLHSAFQMTSVNYIFFTILMFLLFGGLNIFYIKTSRNKKLINFELQLLKTINILYVFISIVYVLCRFYIKYLLIKKLKGYVLYFKFLNLHQPYFFEYINFLNGGFFSDSIVLLSLLTGFTAIYLLNDKDLGRNLINVFYFNIFHIAVLIMVYSTNLLIMFISFELIFLPTLFFIWNIYYVKKGDKAVQFLFNWTYLGSLLVLFNILYIFKTKHTLQYEILYTLSFTTTEQSVLFILIFLGFGVKIPLFPFHFWLTKVHVEASAGFSIFLSGFLVKTALYCFYFLKINIVNNL